jgi:DNA-directed RNA polymerase specialized sigma24 family protein
MSRSESPSQTTGAHRRHRAPVQRSDARRRRPQGTLPQQPPAHYEPYLDGLFTYCLSVLCEHDAAAGALGDVLALAERQRGRLRNPELRRPWLYALARWVCLRRLADRRSGAGVPQTAPEVAARRRREIASLAWPEAAGTTPQQREALELAVRHQLQPHEVAHVLGIEPDAARALLSRAACEVERTRAALAVVELGKCPAVARLAGDSQVMLGAALRRELVRHVDECPRCRTTSERAVAAGPWPGLATTAASAVLAVIEAPRSAAYAGLLHAMGAGTGRNRDATPRFDRRGFPMDFKDRAARRAQLRNRAVTTTVVAAVVAAPVLALWAAYRGAPLISDEKDDNGSLSASDREGLDVYPYQNAGSAGNAGSTSPGSTPEGRRSERLSVSVASANPSAAGAPGTGEPTGGGASRPGQSRPGWLMVAAEPSGQATTRVTLTAGGGSPVRWTADTSAYWLRLDRTSGTLKPGESTTVMITVDRSAEPSGPWRGRILFGPSGAVVMLEGRGTQPSASASPTPGTSSPVPEPSQSDSGSASPAPSDSAPPQ